MRFRYKSLILLLMAALTISATPFVAASTEPVHAQHGIVVSVHELASRAGVEIMQAGGNAVDAAVATGFALAVVHPPAGNLGGGGFMLVRMADGKTHFLDYREKAPAAATRDMYLDAHGNVIEGASEYGYKAIAVPGSVAGMVYAEQKYGKLTLKQVLAPAIRLAREGYALSWGEARDFHDKYLAEFPESRRIFQRKGNYYQPGEIFRQPDLARTLERIAAKPDDFYHGALARELAAAMLKGRHVEMFTHADTNGCNNIFNLLILEHLVQAGPLHVEDLTAQGQDSLEVAVLSRRRDHQRASAVVWRNGSD